MRLIPVHGSGAVDSATISRVERAVGGLATLADVLAWCRAQTPVLEVAEIVTQDEYTHDVVVPLDGHRYLSFDTT